MRQLVYKDEDFVFETKVFNGNTFLHCEVFNWNKAVYKKLMETFDEYCIICNLDVIYTATPNPKFAKLFPGWEFLGIHEQDGKQYEVLRWVLK